jgi:hypothetical protein
MKKITSFILATCILLAVPFAFTSCFHKCDFSGEWSADNVSHWRECADEECTEISDKADHVWNEGEITAEPTQEADGTKTYTCEVCRTTKPEAIVFTGLTEKEWNEIFSEKNFDNFTYVEEATVKGDGFEIVSTTVYKCTATQGFVSLEMLGQKQNQFVGGDEAKEIKKAMQKSIFDLLKFEDFEYDAENKIYNLVGELYVESIGGNASEATLRFENGIPVELIYTGEVESEGIKMEYISKATFSDFGTTEVKIEEAMT